MKRIFVNLGIISLLLACQASFAGAFFNVSSKGLELTINTTTPNHVYPAAGIKINTPGYSLSNTADCISGSNRYCTFSVSDTTPKTISVAGLGGPFSITLCLNGNGPLTCQTYNISLPGLTYMANAGNNTISICSVGADGSLQICREETDVSFSIPKDIVLNNQANIAYVFNDGNSTISTCTIDLHGSIVPPCSVAIPGGDISFGGLNPSSTILYLSNYDGNSVLICTVNPDGSLVTPCPTSTGNGTFNGPNGRVGFNPGGTHIYVPNFDASTVSICPVLANGLFGTCVTSNGNSTINTPLGAALNADGTMLYVANTYPAPGTVSICPVNADGSLGTCTVTTGNGAIDFARADVANLFVSSNKFAYMPNNSGTSNSLTICAVLSTGLFGTCTIRIDSTFNAVDSAWLSFG